MTRLERRTLLGTVGSSLIGAAAGCLDFGFLQSDESPQRFGADELEPILATEGPAVARPAPVQPSEEAVAAALDRLDELIDAVPDPLTADDVPNEAVRDAIDREREIARYRRDELADAPDRFHRLRRAVHARRYAGEAATAYEAVAADRSRNDVESERETLGTRLERRRAEREYRGADPQRALLLAYHCERELASGGRWLENRPRDDTRGVLAIGEIGGAIEQARAAIEFVEELDRQHEARLDDGDSFETSFEDALNRSLEVVDAADVPDRSTDLVASVDADVSDTIAERVLRESAVSLIRTTKRTREAATADDPATALWHACAFERDRRAFEALAERVEAGAHWSLETVDDIREVRESALETAAESPFDPDEPSLGGDFLGKGYERLRQIDSQIQDAIDRGWQTNLESQYTEYVVIGAQLEAIPDAVSVLKGRLER